MIRNTALREVISPNTLLRSPVPTALPLLHASFLLTLHIRDPGTKTCSALSYWVRDAILTVAIIPVGYGYALQIWLY
jgi:hypothetical protein